MNKEYFKGHRLWKKQFVQVSKKGQENLHIFKKHKEMSVENLDKIFHPNSIAVVGASERKGSVGAALMDNLIERGFSGDIYPVNPKHKKIRGKSACPSIAAIEVQVDLAILVTL